jgi:maltose O-acetyltransferase
MVTEKEKMLSGEMYDATNPQLTAERRRARDLCKSLNESHDSEQELRNRIIRELFGSAGDDVWIGDCAVNCDHLQTVSKGKIGSLTTSLPPAKLTDVGRAIRFALDI